MSGQPQMPSARWRDELRSFEFTTVTESNWSAAHVGEHDTVQIEPGVTGWRVSVTRNSDNQLLRERFFATANEAAEAAVEEVLVLDQDSLVRAVIVDSLGGRRVA